MILTARILGPVVATVFVATGLAVASTALALILSLAVLAALAALCVRQEVPRIAASPFGRNAVGLAVHVAVGFVVVVSGVIGIAALLGGAAVALVAAAALAVLGYRRLRGDAGGTTGHDPERRADSVVGSCADTAPAGAGGALLVPPDPAALSTTELCRAWRASFLLVQNAGVPGALEHAADLRRRYLDELAHRHPDGFRRWLEDGARAAGDPSRYVGSELPDGDQGGLINGLGGTEAGANSLTTS